MTAFWGSLQTRTARRVLASLGVLALIALAVLIPSAASASGCTDEWSSAASGSWFTAGNWSKGVPAPSDEVCITVEGTYTVTMTQTSGGVTVKSLTLGGASGTQTLAVGSSSSANAVLATTAGMTIAAHGSLTMTNGDSAGNSVTLEGSISNAGTITSEVAHGGNRTIKGSLTNTGTLTINKGTAYNGESTALKNEGTLNVASEQSLAVGNKASFTNGTGGKVVATGSGNVFMESGTSFTEGAGTTSGTEPVVVDDAALKYEAGGGESTIATRGEGATLSGSSSSSQSLSIESTCSENSRTTAESGFTNGGAIVLTNAGVCGNNATLTVSGGTLTNTGTIKSEVEHGGNRTIKGSLTNTGTLTINKGTAYNGESAGLKNEGTVNVANEVSLAVGNKASFTNGAGGKIVATGSGNVFMESGTSFTEGAGTTSGTKPVVVDDAALKYEAGGGESTIATRGEGSTLSGSSSAKQTLSVESTCGEHNHTKAESGFTNGGAIVLTNADVCGNNATLTVSGGTLSNSGTISSEVEHGGTRTIQGSLTNTGTLTINRGTAYNGESASLKNEGTVNVASEVSLTVSNKGSFTNGAGGKIVAAGSGNVFMEPGTAFSEGAGTASGTLPVIVRDASLTYTGAGASTIATEGEGTTLSGGPSAGQSLLIESTCSEHARTTAAASLTNGGTITLTNADVCGNNATLTVSAGTLSNSGTIATEVPHGGTRTIQGNLKNTGTLTINRGTAYNGESALLTNEGTLNLANEQSLTVSNKGSFTNGTGGKIVATGSGNVFVEPGNTFTEGAGTTSGTLPVIVRDGAIHYVGTGKPSVIAARGEGSTLSGPINAGQTLSIQSTCSEHARVAAGGTLVNSGTIVLTNGDVCGNNATLNLAGATLENKGTLKVLEPHSGSRTVEGTVKNEKTVVLGPSASLKVSGFTQTSKGSITDEIAGTSKYGSLTSSGPATLAGALSVKAVSKFKGALGNSFAVLSSSARTGTLSDIDSATIGKAGLYYKPVYSATGVTLVVTQATLAGTPAEGAPGTTVKLTGSGWPGEDTIKIVFTDSAAVKTTLGSAVTNASGEFEIEVAVPAGAALGASKFTATSTIVGVNLSTPFNVT